MNNILSLKSYTDNCVQYSHLIPMESKDVPFSYLNENKWPLKECFISSKATAGVMEFLINQTPRPCIS